MMLHKESKILVNNTTFTIDEVLHMAAKIMYAMENQGLKKEIRVGIYMDRSIELCASILAVLQTKGCYLPIDLSLPSSLIEYMLEDSKIDIVLVKNEIPIDFEFKGKIISIQDVLAYNVPLRKKNQINMSSNGCAYIIYTSGSSGMPKGVEIPRKSLKNFIEGMDDLICFSPNDIIGCFTTVSFDIFFLECVLPLFKGLTVVMATDVEQNNPKLLSKLILENHINIVQMTPSRMELLLNFDSELYCLKAMKVMMIGGEVFPQRLLETLKKKTSARIYNMYGPTETTIWSTVSELTNKRNIDIGKPLRNIGICIVDEDRKSVPNGHKGEICIYGPCLAKGYVGKADLTKERFVYINGSNGVKKAYLTGDIGSFLPDGSIAFYGRKDNQVKIHGYRIELEAIEFHISSFESVKQSVVSVSADSENKRLIAFYTSEKCINEEELKRKLSLSLPHYMIPSTFVRVKNFVYTSNGKINRGRVNECTFLENDYRCIDSDLEFTIGELEIEERVLKIIANNISISSYSEIDTSANLANIGVDSISFIRIVVSIEREFDFEFDDEMLVITYFPTVKAIIDYVRKKTKEHNTEEKKK